MNKEEKIILENISLVYYMLKKMKLFTKCEEWYDVGVIGLIKGVKSYDPTKGSKISTYLSFCIKNEILAEIRRLKSEKRKANNNTVSLYKEINKKGEDSIYLIDVIPSDYDVESEVIKNDVMNDLLDCLSEREKNILISSYGLLGNKKLSQKEISKKLNISQAQVSRILKKILNKIKLKKGDVVYE